MQETNVQNLVHAYLKAIDARDLSQCVEFYADDASIRFISGVYQGKEAVEEWHKARFKANFKVISIEGIRTQGDSVVVDAVITSDKLKTWKIKKVSGTVNLQLQQGKIKNAKFSMRVTNPLEEWS